jgi:hypothetical protein
MASAPRPPSAPDLDILRDQVTIHPGGYIEPPNASPERNLIGQGARFRESPFDFLREISLHVSGSGWRAYDGAIGQPMYYPGFTEHMKHEVLATPMLNAKIEELAEKRVDVEEKEGRFGDRLEDKMVDGKRGKRKVEIERSLRELADEWTESMICKFESKRFIRGAYYLVTQLLTRAYDQG